MFKFYSNENFPIQMVHHLRSLSYDVLTSYEAGQANQKIPDDQVLQYATDLDRIVLTENRLDFLQLHSTVIHHSGIVLCKADRDYLGKVEILHDFLTRQNEMKLDNRLIRVLKQNMTGQKQVFRIQEYDR
jgi:predicted nuclease of predicted toxin-antitoxin system